LVGTLLYRTGKAIIIHKERLDENYCVVFLYAPKQQRRRGTGSLYYYALSGLKARLEFSHAFTSFQNRSGEPMPVAWTDRDVSSATHNFFVENTSSKDGTMAKRRLSRRSLVATPTDFDDSFDDQSTGGGGSTSELVNSPTQQRDSIVDTGNRVFFTNWDTAFIMQVHHAKEHSFTRRMADLNPGDSVKYWGPYYSEYHQLNKWTTLPPLVLIATGAGANYILDFYNRMIADGEHCSLVNPVQVYFSTSSLGLFQFVTDLLCKTALKNLTVTAHLTSNDALLDIAMDDEQAHADADVSTKHSVKLGRMSLQQTIKSAVADSEVFFCGAPSIQWEIELLCGKEYLFLGHRSV
jgi:hypothetical protein